MKVVIDTRFFIEWFFTKDDSIKVKLKNKLDKIIRRNEGIIPTIVLNEVMYIVCKRRGVEEAKIRYNSLLVSGLKIEELTNEIAELAGILKCKYSDIPMGDCIIAATAIKNKAKVLSDDDHFDGIEEVKREWIQ